MNEQTKQRVYVVVAVLVFIFGLGQIAASSGDFDHSRNMTDPGIQATYEDVPNSPTVIFGTWVLWIAVDAVACMFIYYMMTN